MITKKKSEKTTKRNWKRTAFQLTLIAAVVALFFIPDSPLGPSQASANAAPMPEIPPALVPVLLSGAGAVVLRVRRAFHL